MNTSRRGKRRKWVYDPDDTSESYLKGEVDVVSLVTGIILVVFVVVFLSLYLPK